MSNEKDNDLIYKSIEKLSFTDFDSFLNNISNDEINIFGREYYGENKKHK